MPFRKSFKKPGVRRFLWPFTIALALLLLAVFLITGVA